MPDDLLLKLGLRISTLRKKRGCTQTVFAEKVGLDRSFLADVERGKRNISVLNLQIIAQDLNVSLSQLFSRLS
jgi:transcriptional regulator with XRE-family HTH domain